MRATNASLIAAIVVCGLASFVGGASAQAPRPHPDLQQFFLIAGADDDRADGARDEIAAAWRDGYAGMVWDMLRFMRPPPPPRPFRAPRAFDSNDPRSVGWVGLRSNGNIPQRGSTAGSSG